MNPLIVALDLEPGEAQKAAQQLAPHVEIFKIGGRLFTSVGPDVVRQAQAGGRKVFLDLKFHDIPNTVGESCRNAVRLGVWGLTIHASGGFAMMVEAVKAVREEAARRRTERPLIFGVTVLTSMTDPELQEVGIPRTALRQVQALAALAKKAGLDGVVASGNEIEAVRKTAGAGFLIAVPGIRSARDAQGDQRRVMTAEKALAAGADYVIVGRPIVDAPDRARAAQQILSEIRQLPGKR